jgi:hypothetical protein
MCRSESRRQREEEREAVAGGVATAQKLNSAMAIRHRIQKDDLQQECNACSRGRCQPTPLVELSGSGSN